MNKQLSHVFLIPLNKGQWGDIDENGWTTAHFAAKYAEVSALDFLSTENPKMLYIKNNKGVTPAHIAAANSNVNVLKFLYKFDPKLLQDTSDIGWNVSHFAAVNGNTDVINFLKEIHLDLDKEDNLGFLPMMIAHKNKHFQTVKAIMFNSKQSFCTIS